jgi:hypothetical protein
MGLESNGPQRPEEALEKRPNTVSFPAHLEERGGGAMICTVVGPGGRTADFIWLAAPMDQISIRTPNSKCRLFLKID